MAERESSNETYIRDLETKLSSFNERDENRDLQVSDLKKEVAQLRQSETGSAKYLSDLEAQLDKSGSLAASLAIQVDKLEKEVVRREAMYKDLEARLALVDTTGDNKLLLQELDEKDNKVADLERKLENAVRSMEEVGKERAALQEQAVKDETERTALKARLTQRSRENLANGTLAPPPVATRSNSADSSTFYTPATELTEGAATHSFDDKTPTPRSPALDQTIIPSDGLDEQLRDLQVAHTRTLAELDEVSAKYRDSLKEIADLSFQVQEADLSRSPQPPSTPTRGRSVSPTDSQRSSSALAPTGSRNSLASLNSSPGTARRRTHQKGDSLSASTSLASPSSPNGQGFGSRGGGHLNKQM